jgi:hypothetical protein
MFKKLLITLSIVAFIGMHADAFIDDYNDVDQASTDAEIKGHKCKTYKNLTVCNTIRTGALTVLGNETVNGNLSVNGTLSFSGSTIPNLNYGFFYSNDLFVLPSEITLISADTTPGAFTPTTGNCGVTIAQAGTYLVWYAICSEDDASSWILNLAGTPITGSGIMAQIEVTATGFAVVTVPTGGQALTITSPTGSRTTLNLLPGASAISLMILRIA